MRNSWLPGDVKVVRTLLVLTVGAHRLGRVEDSCVYPQEVEDIVDTTTLSSCSVSLLNSGCWWDLFRLARGRSPNEGRDLLVWIAHRAGSRDHIDSSHKIREGSSRGRVTQIEWFDASLGLSRTSFGEWLQLFLREQLFFDSRYGTSISFEMGRKTCSVRRDRTLWSD